MVTNIGPLTTETDNMDQNPQSQPTNSVALECYTVNSRVNKVYWLIDWLNMTFDHCFFCSEEFFELEILWWLAWGGRFWWGLFGGLAKSVTFGGLRSGGPLDFFGSGFSLIGHFWVNLPLFPLPHHYYCLVPPAASLQLCKQSNTVALLRS